MDIAEKFPALKKAKEIGKLWKDFFLLVQDINKEMCDADELSRKIIAVGKLVSLCVPNEGLDTLYSCTFEPCSLVY